MAAGCVAIWMGYVLPKLLRVLEGPVTVFRENQAALSLLVERCHKRMSQHLEPIESRLQWWVQEYCLQFVYVETDAN